MAEGLVRVTKLTAPVGGDERRALQPVRRARRRPQGGLPWRDVPVYVSAQAAGAFAGVAAADVMFELPVFCASQKLATAAYIPLSTAS